MTINHCNILDLILSVDLRNLCVHTHTHTHISCSSDPYVPYLQLQFKLMLSLLEYVESEISKRVCCGEDTIANYKYSNNNPMYSNTSMPR